MDVSEIERFAENFHDEYAGFSALAEHGEGECELPSPEAVRHLMTTAAKLYTARHQRGEKHTPIHSDLGPTEAVTVVSSILHAVELDVFELTMWRGMTGE